MDGFNLKDSPVAEPHLRSGTTAPSAKDNGSSKPPMKPWNGSKHAARIRLQC